MEKAITLRLEAEREDDLYVAHCPDLDVSSYGDTIEDAFAHLEQAILLYLDTIEEDGDRERVFAERGLGIVSRSCGTTVRIPVCREHPVSASQPVSPGTAKFASCMKYGREADRTPSVKAQGGRATTTETPGERR